jgi:ATP-dependent DNA helicase UvrD/PcrA
MFAALGSRDSGIRTHRDKVEWVRDMEALLKLRDSGTIGEVVDWLIETKHPPIPDAVERKERELRDLGPRPAFEEKSPLETLSRLRQVRYREVTALDGFLDERTPFLTKHGVKGAEFENVLIVHGRGWNLYNFNQFLDWAPDKYPTDKLGTYERNRNLFKVVCSRAKRRLALLFTQEVSDNALATLAAWFGNDAIHPIHLPQVVHS